MRVDLSSVFHVEVQTRSVRLAKARRALPVLAAVCSCLFLSFLSDLVALCTVTQTEEAQLQARMVLWEPFAPVPNDGHSDSCIVLF